MVNNIYVNSNEFYYNFYFKVPNEAEMRPESVAASGVSRAKSTESPRGTGKLGQNAKPKPLRAARQHGSAAWLGSMVRRLGAAAWRHGGVAWECSTVVRLGGGGGGGGGGAALMQAVAGLWRCEEVCARVWCGVAWPWLAVSRAHTLLHTCPYTCLGRF